jgi:hypothetical protein
MGPWRVVALGAPADVSRRRKFGRAFRRSHRGALGGTEPWVTVATYENEPVYDPDVDVYLVPGERFAVLSTVRGYADEGISGTVADGWLCDAQTRTCE